MSDTATTRSGPSTVSLLGVAFVVLKLAGVIGWSWWWVTLPFWGGLAFFGAVALVVFIVALTLGARNEFAISKRRKTISKRRY